MPQEILRHPCLLLHIKSPAFGSTMAAGCRASVMDLWAICLAMKGIKASARHDSLRTFFRSERAGKHSVRSPA